MRARFLSPGLAAALLAAAAGAAPADGLHTLQLRGRVLGADERPLAGAQVQATGGVRVVTQTDGEGRYSLVIAMGSIGALSRGPFHLDVRATWRRRRVPFAGGGPVFTLDVERLPGSPARARVLAGSPAAAAAVAAAFGQAGSTHAWVDADFSAA
ncbi:MAG TPA: carboxypeptidase-like regulatory domain-containing protein, partial [Candidatus Eisenbacteria bacterium]|nr:carboxypeptidase-like regulatory domain-containing protein [Candidatus Eisenbacteria bacterium]